MAQNSVHVIPNEPEAHVYMERLRAASTLRMLETDQLALQGYQEAILGDRERTERWLIARGLLADARLPAQAQPGGYLEGSTTLEVLKLMDGIAHEFPASKKSALARRLASR